MHMHKTRTCIVTCTLYLLHAQHMYQVTCNPAMKRQKTERRISPAPAPAPATAPAHAPVPHLHFKLHLKPQEHLHN